MVYVDQSRYEPAYGERICRMRADTARELRAMARRISAVRCVHRGKPREHYVLDMAERLAALEAGAVEGKPVADGRGACRRGGKS